MIPRRVASPRVDTAGAIPSNLGPKSFMILPAETGRKCIDNSITASPTLSTRCGAAHKPTTCTTETQAEILCFQLLLVRRRRRRHETGLKVTVRGLILFRSAPDLIQNSARVIALATDERLHSML
jgi:hypothetical protein